MYHDLYLEFRYIMYIYYVSNMYITYTAHKYIYIIHNYWNEATRQTDIMNGINVFQLWFDTINLFFLLLSLPKNEEEVHQNSLRRISMYLILINETKVARIETVFPKFVVHDWREEQRCHCFTLFNVLYAVFAIYWQHRTCAWNLHVCSDRKFWANQRF